MTERIDTVDTLAKRILWRLDILSQTEEDDSSTKLVARRCLQDIAALRRESDTRSPNLYRMLFDSLRLAEYQRAIAIWRASIYGF